MKYSDPLRDHALILLFASPQFTAMDPGNLQTDERLVGENRWHEPGTMKILRGALSEISPLVAKLIKSFGAPWEITESLDDFRYEPNQAFSFGDVLGFVFQATFANAALFLEPPRSGVRRCVLRNKPSSSRLLLVSNLNYNRGDWVQNRPFLSSNP